MNENVGLKIKNTKVINKEKAKKTSAKTVLNVRGLPNAFSKRNRKLMTVFCQFGKSNKNCCKCCTIVRTK